MSKKLLSLVLSGLLIQTISFMSPASGQTRAEKEAIFAQRMKTSITKFGVGPEARVRVKLREKTTLDGYVSQLGENSFVITNASTGKETPVAYSEVKQVKGRNLSTGAKISIGVVLALVVAIIIALTTGDRKPNNSGVQCGGVTTPCP